MTTKTRMMGIMIAMAITSHQNGGHRFKLDSLWSLMKKYERSAYEVA